MVILYEVHDIIERVGPSEKSDAGLAEFRATIEAMTLTELQMRGGLFT